VRVRHSLVEHHIAVVGRLGAALVDPVRAVVRPLPDALFGEVGGRVLRQELGEHGDVQHGV